MNINKQQGFSLIELTAVMTISAMLAGGAAIVYDAHLKDSEEYNHIRNAQALAGAVQAMIVDDNSGPAIDATTTFTLTQIYASDKLVPVIDPSTTDSSLYSAGDSKVIVENKLTTDGSSRAFYKFYVTLKSVTGNYVYIQQLDTDTTPVDAVDLTRAQVKIPKRDETDAAGTTH